MRITKLVIVISLIILNFACKEDARGTADELENIKAFTNRYFSSIENDDNDFWLSATMVGFAMAFPQYPALFDEISENIAGYNEIHISAYKSMDKSSYDHYYIEVRLRVNKEYVYYELHIISEDHFEAINSEKNKFNLYVNHIKKQ